MHPSGVIAVSTIETGVMFLNFTKAFVQSFRLDPTEQLPDQETPTPTDSEDEDNGLSGAGLFVFAFCWMFVILFIILCIAWQLRKRKIAATTLLPSRLSSRPGMPNRTANPVFTKEIASP